MKYFYMTIVALLSFIFNSGCSSFERYRDKEDVGEKYPLEIISYTKINEAEIYGKRIFILSDPNIDNKILSSNTSDKLTKLLKIKAKHLNYDDRFREKAINVVNDQKLADYLLYYNFEIKQTGTTNISDTSGVQLGSSTTQGAGTIIGTNYSNHYSSNSNYQFYENINSILFKTYQSHTMDRSINVYGQEIYIALIDAKKYKSTNDIDPLWIGKVNVASYKKEMKGLVDILIIAGITYLGQDIDISVNYYSNDVRLNQIIAYLYTK